MSLLHNYVLCKKNESNKVGRNMIRLLEPSLRSLAILSSFIGREVHFSLQWAPLLIL